MELGLRGRRALVTGASSGLGLGAARALAAEGANVVLVARSAEKLAAAAATRAGGADARGRRQRHRTGAPDGGARRTSCWAASTSSSPTPGGPPAGNFASTDLDAYLPAIQLNLLSTVAMCKATVPAMCDRGWGRVVAITSVSVRQPIPHLILSNTARAGLTGFLKTLALEVAGNGVTVNSLQPGLHRTDRLVGLYADPDAVAQGIPAKKLGDPDDFGRIAAFLCSDAAKFITGSAIPVDGGAYAGLQ